MVFWLILSTDRPPFGYKFDFFLGSESAYLKKKKKIKVSKIKSEKRSSSNAGKIVEPGRGVLTSRFG